MDEGVAIGVFVAVIGGYLCHLVGKMLEGWELKRISSRTAARRRAARVMGGSR
jgi:hypothetical protein